MGRSGNFTCVDCKKTYYLGYGSYLSWLDHVGTIKEYDALDGENKSLSKNQNFHKCLIEHEGHDWFAWSDDHCSESNGNLYVDGVYGRQDELLCEGFSEYEYINMESDTSCDSSPKITKSVTVDDVVNDIDIYVEETESGLLIPKFID